MTELTKTPGPKKRLSLEELAQTIGEECRLAEAKAKSGAAEMSTAFQHALEAGGLLLEAKRRVDHGKWEAWLKEHFPASERTAQDWMRLAANPQRAADLSQVKSVREGLRILTGPPKESKKSASSAAKKSKAVTGSNLMRGETFDDDDDDGDPVDPMCEKWQSLSIEDREVFMRRKKLMYNLHDDKWWVGGELAEWHERAEEEGRIS